MSKKDLVIPLVPAALSAALLAGGVTVFSACEPRPDGTWMHCHQCQNSVAASAVVVFFIPGVICPLCMMKTMRCHTVFQPFVRIMSVLVAGGGVAAVVNTLKKDKASQA